MAVARSNFSDLMQVKGYFREIANDQYAVDDGQLEKLFNVVTSDKQLERWSEVDMFGAFSEKTEMGLPAYDEFKQAYDMSITPKEYAMYTEIGEWAYDDDQTGILKKVGKGFGESAKYTRAVQCMSVFNNGFTSETSADGQYVFDNDHTRIDGGTAQSNILATASDLAVASLLQMLIDFKSQLNGRGLKISMVPADLLVPGELEYVARQILESEKQAFVADNTKNVIQKEKLNLIVNNYLTDTDAWFMLADKSKRGLFLVDRKSLKTDADQEFFTRNYRFYAANRFYRGAPYWRGLFGTPGAA